MVFDEVSSESGKRGFTLRTVHENPEVDQFIQLFIELVILGQVKKIEKIHIYFHMWAF